MNRSQRRAAVVRRSIAAGLLCVGLGAVAAAPAVADSGGETSGAVASNNSRVARGGSVVPAGRPENVSPSTRRGGRIPVQPADDGWHPEPDWCHFDWPDWWIVPPQVYYGRRNMFILPQAPTMASPPSLVAGVADTGAHASTDMNDEAEAAPAAATAAPDAPAAVPPAFAASIPLVQPPRLDVPVPATPPLVPESVAPEPNRAPVRLPDIPSANLGQIAVVALPGLAGIAALTVLGGFLGYRQAKAGYVLRAAGTARFLQ